MHAINCCKHYLEQKGHGLESSTGEVQKVRVRCSVADALESETCPVAA